MRKGSWQHAHSRHEWVKRARPLQEALDGWAGLFHASCSISRRLCRLGVGVFSAPALLSLPRIPPCTGGCRELWGPVGASSSMQQQRPLPLPLCCRCSSAPNSAPNPVWDLPLTLPLTLPTLRSSARRRRLPRASRHPACSCSSSSSTTLRCRTLWRSWLRSSGSFRCVVLRSRESGSCGLWLT